MKILHIAPIGHHAEGIGSVLDKLVLHQIKDGEEVKVVSVYENKIYDSNFVKTIKGKNAFAAFVSSWKPNIVIFHSLYLKEYIVFSRVLNQYDTPYLLQLHGALSKSNYQKHKVIKYLLNCLFYKKFIRGARTIIYLNKQEYNNSIVKGYNSSYSILPNGCDSHELSLTPKKKSNQINIAFIGRISIITKGLDVLVDAIKIIKEKNLRGFHVNFYGNGNDVGKLKNMLKDIGDYASFKGGVYGKEKDETLKSCDIMVLTSRSEGMPMGVLEALAYSIPCIVTPGTNMAEAISEHKAGWASELDAQKLADTIIQALDEYLQNKIEFRRNAHNLSKEYDWNLISKQSVTTYKEYIH